MGCLKRICPVDGEPLSKRAFAYNSTVGARVKEIVDGVGTLDDIMNTLALLALVAYTITVMQGRPNLTLKKISAGIFLAKNACTFFKLVGGLEALATNRARFDIEGKTNPDDPTGKKIKVWTKLEPVPALAGVILTMARLAVCVLAIQTLAPDAVRLGSHAIWLNALVIAGFASITILYLANAAYKYHHKKHNTFYKPEEISKARRGLVASCLDAAALPQELGVLAESAPAPVLLAFACVACVAAAVNSFKDWGERHDNYAKAAAPAA